MGCDDRASRDILQLLSLWLSASVSSWMQSFLSFSGVALQPQLKCLIPSVMFWTSCSISLCCEKGPMRGQSSTQLQKSPSCSPHAAVKTTFPAFFLLRFFKFIMWTILKSLLNLLQYYFCFMFYFFGCKAHGILVPVQGLSLHPVPRKHSLNHRTTRENPVLTFLESSLPFLFPLPSFPFSSLLCFFLFLPILFLSSIFFTQRITK